MADDKLRATPAARKVGGWFGNPASMTFLAQAQTVIHVKTWKHKDTNETHFTTETGT